MKLLFWKRDEPYIGCEFQESCDCNHNKEFSCEDCYWYYWLDSGYGYCKAMPIPEVVAWCKDVCVFFEGKLNDNRNN